MNNGISLVEKAPIYIKKLLIYILIHQHSYQIPLHGAGFVLTEKFVLN